MSDLKAWNHFDQAIAQGRGVVFLTGHFGCWELLAVSSGYFLKPSFLVAKPLDFKPAEKLVRTIRGVSGNQCITKEKSMRRLIQASKTRGYSGRPLGSKYRLEGRGLCALF